MSDSVEVNEPIEDAPEGDEAPPSPPAPPVSPLRRTGCAILLVIWFAVLLTPCFFIALATQGEILLHLGDAPGQDLRFWLVMEEERRGIGMSTPAVMSGEGGGVCVQTDVRFFLWQGQGEAVSYCECYTRAAENEAWTLASAAQQACEAP